MPPQTSESLLHFFLFHSQNRISLQRFLKNAKQVFDLFIFLTINRSHSTSLGGEIMYIGTYRQKERLGKVLSQLMQERVMIFTVLVAIVIAFLFPDDTSLTRSIFWLSVVYGAFKLHAGANHKSFWNIWCIGASLALLNELMSNGELVEVGHYNPHLLSFFLLAFLTEIILESIPRGPESNNH